MTGVTRHECDTAIRASLEGLKFEGIDELLAEAGIETLPYDDAYVDAVIVRLTGILSARVRAIEAQAKAWADIADAAEHEAARFAIEFERFRQLAVASIVH